MLERGLEEHADDGHHGQAAVCKLGRELFRLLSRVRGGQHLEAVVARGAALVVIEAAAELHEAEVRGNLCPACHRHLGDGRKPIRDVGELQAGGRRQEARPAKATTQHASTDLSRSSVTAAAASSHRLSGAECAAACP